MALFMSDLDDVDKVFAVCDFIYGALLTKSDRGYYTVSSERAKEALDYAKELAGKYSTREHIRGLVSTTEMILHNLEPLHAAVLGLTKNKPPTPL